MDLAVANGLIAADSSLTPFRFLFGLYNPRVSTATLLMHVLTIIFFLRRSQAYLTEPTEMLRRIFFMGICKFCCY
jgi:hypothetical protein